MSCLDSFSKKNSNIKFNENPSSESRDVPCGQTDGPTDMMKLIVALSNFANAAKNVSYPFFYKGNNNSYSFFDKQPL